MCGFVVVRVSSYTQVTLPKNSDNEQVIVSILHCEPAPHTPSTIGRVNQKKKKRSN